MEKQSIGGQYLEVTYHKLIGWIIITSMLINGIIIRKYNHIISREIIEWDTMYRSRHVFIFII